LFAVFCVLPGLCGFFVLRNEFCKTTSSTQPRDLENSNKTEETKLKELQTREENLKANEEKISKQLKAREKNLKVKEEKIQKYNERLEKFIANLENQNEIVEDPTPEDTSPILKEKNFTHEEIEEELFL